MHVTKLMVRENKVNLFKRSEVAISIIDAMREDLERTVNYKWRDMFDRVASDASWRDKKWMKKEMNNLKSEYQLTQIAILRLQGEEDVPQVTQTNASNMHHGAGVTLGQLNHSTIGTNNPYAQLQASASAQAAYTQLQMQAQYDRHQAYSFGWSKP